MKNDSENTAVSARCTVNQKKLIKDAATKECRSVNSFILINMIKISNKILGK